MDIVAIAGTGFGLGFLGQGVRVLIGLYKTWAQPDITVSQWRITRVIVTLILGGIAGCLAALTLSGEGVLQRSEVVTYIAAGYAGSDFIEGVLSYALPKSTAP